ncbi:MAG: hypothetical protein ACRDP6_14635 [Actinoallomurus sp.]
MSDEPTTSELERLIERNHRETSADILDLKTQQTANLSTIVAQLDRYLLAAVYDADQKARAARDESRDDRLKLLEEDSKAERKRREEDVASNKKILRSAVIVAIFGILSTVISGVIVAAIVKSGGAH